MRTFILLIWPWPEYDLKPPINKPVWILLNVVVSFLTFEVVYWYTLVLNTELFNDSKASNIKILTPIFPNLFLFDPLPYGSIFNVIDEKLKD